MAITHLPRCTPAPADPIHLHAQAMNALSRCLRELRQDRTDYEVAELHLADAADALRTLALLDKNAVH